MSVKAYSKLYPLRLTSPLPLQHSTYSRNKLSGGDKEDTNRIGKTKISLFTDDMTVHIEDPKDLIRKVLQPISKVTGYKTNAQKSETM